MKRRTYAKEITKDYLIKLGITDVTPDGLHIYKGEKEVPQHKTRSGKKYYYTVVLYDPELRQTVPVEKRTSSSGQFTLGVHVVNFVWNKSDKAQGMVIDHLDNNPFNNDITNLQVKTPKENLHKEHKDWNTVQIKCKLNKPLSFYEDKLNNYLALYEDAKARHDAKACHALRCNVAQTRARIRYWKAHQEEAEKLNMEKAQEQAKKDAYHERATKLRELEEFVLAARMQYIRAEYEYGPDNFVTQCYKKDWRDAVADRNHFLGITG